VKGLVVRVLNLKLLDEYMSGHAQCRGSLKAWLSEARDATWETPADVKTRYPSASLLSGNRVVFNIAGNAFRLLCAIAYQSRVVSVLKIGTHSEYDKWSL
jgi:mRNA interferase HigB